MREARRNHLINWSEKIASIQMVFATAKGNPKKLHTLGDLKRPGIRVGIGDLTSTSAGRYVKTKLRSQFDLMKGNIQCEANELSELVAALESGQIDVALVWKPIAIQNAGRIGWTDFPGNQEWISYVYAAPLLSSERSESAANFVKWLSSFCARQNLLHYGCDISNPKATRAGCMCEFIFKKTRFSSKISS
jgi:molybdate transport system substrate-binding protein